ncbi:MAG: DNA repair protein RecO [Rhodobacterales bacterium]|nr:MAG: DNA repair protein RecO [Rhodobacterales bacterium]
MRWEDEGILLAARRHGESAAIVELFTPDHGRAVGVVRGGGGRRMAPVLQPGAQLSVTWSARLEEHMGAFVVEPLRSRAAQVMQGRLSLAGLNAVCAILSFALPEREVHAALYARTGPLLDLLGQDDLWPLAYLGWELRLLEELGFGLDLTCCAVTGATEGLAYVSPRTGRAVSSMGAGAWADRLLPLSPALIGAASDDESIRAGLAVTGYFLEQRVAPALGSRPLPAARQRLVALI